MRKFLKANMIYYDILLIENEEDFLEKKWENI